MTAVNRTIEYVWIAALGTLLVYEVFAVTTGRETLSRSVWNAERTPYGLGLACVAGILMGHLFATKAKVTAIVFLIGVGLGWFAFNF